MPLRKRLCSLPRTLWQLSIGPAVALSLNLAIVLPAMANDKPDSEAFFESRVRPLLVEHCYECHSVEADEQAGGLLLDTADSVRKGGSLGPAVVPSKLKPSHLWRAVNYEDFDLQMPPDGKLNDKDIETLRLWIQSGAYDPRIDHSQADQTRGPGDRSVESHWAFVTPSRMSPKAWASLPPSKAKPASDLNDPIDEVAQRLASDSGLSPNQVASAETVLRRLHFDLSGLPPSHRQIKDLATDTRPDALVRRTNRLLADPQFAERFSRHWLDVARYADTKGYATAGKNRELVGSHRYRDWVMRSFAADMPYDEMIRHQLAADKTDPDNKRGHADAMGFLTVGRHFLSYQDTIDDRIDVISRGLLGLTVACARCHDHKFDPIPTIDYYSLYNILDNSVAVKQEQIEAGKSPLMLVDRPKVRDTRVFVRGDRGRQGDVAPRRYLTAFRTPSESMFRQGSGRYELAKAIASADNPLTARVWVNRLWGQLLGSPLVDSPSDFGFRTEAPRLVLGLDDLAAEFAEHWSTKRTIRRIVNSRLYQQSSRTSDTSAQHDPDNRCWTHALPRRRDFESLRDSVLLACNHLDSQFGGKSAEITQPVLSPRRTVYAYIDRQNLPGLFRTFDFASPDMHSPHRYYTTVPQQSLFLMNHPQIIHAAQLIARTTSGKHDTQKDQASDSDRIGRLFTQTLQRLPNDAEMQAALQFVSTPAKPVTLAFDPKAQWRYGVGKFDNKKNRVTTFRPFEVFAENHWQMTKEFPSKGKAGYSQLGREGGHTAPPASDVVVRRWISPVDGVIRISSMIGHRSKQGDGIDAIINVGGLKLFRGKQKSNNRPLGPLTALVKRGQAVDFISHAGESDSFDSFFWRIKLSVRTADGTSVEADSVNDFSGPLGDSNNEPKTPPSLDRFEQLAQVLLLSNEFAFVD